MVTPRPAYSPNLCLFHHEHHTHPHPRRIVSHVLGDLQNPLRILSLLIISVLHIGAIGPYFPTQFQIQNLKSSEN